MTLFGKGQIKSNKKVAAINRAIIADAKNYVRPLVLAMLREKLGGEKYCLFLRNTLRKDWETEAEKILASCVVCEKGFTPEEWEDRHQPHEKGCGYNEDDMVCFCNCDLNVHAKCCECKQ